VFDFTYDAIDLIPLHLRLFYCTMDTAEGPSTSSFWVNYRQHGARVFQPAYDLVRLY